ncbi:MAG: phosphate ABC transporter ATP-binding protein [Micrococcales bacterium]|nr:phosphate ABC transporter ATP-binding protein [Micrococcales bacterium]NBR54652.1 phosphate ABC transporter ATP-binding protein [Micrococcales bacterium]NBR61103.1 phosphate ABC transporter ATP-binding protein [Actinomycetota bacterium]NBT46606.1 phosphate ABC transporter ATP-binding protein [Actinomycetota bacterium]NDE88575.1 phosphate ABC transporter ATP-binding protein [Micrococcales bacterium]
MTIATTKSALQAEGVSVWFGERKVLEDVNLVFPSNQVTALIGPSGCGKSTFIRTLNRMHELIPGAGLAGSIYLDGEDIYGENVDAVNVRIKVGMVFQKPNPFPTMSIKDNILSGLRLSGRKIENAEELVETSLRRASIWNEVKDRLGDQALSLSGGQQQRLCIARSLAMNPEVLLMDEPCSALDPGSTRRIEETIIELSQSMTIVIVTHNMQQAQRVSNQTAFFLAEENTPGGVVEFGATEQIFHGPVDQRTNDYVNGHFG